MFVDDGVYDLLLGKLQRRKDMQLKSMVQLIFEQGYTVRTGYESVIQLHTVTLRALQIRLKNRSGGLLTFTDLEHSHRLNNPSKYAQKVKVL